MWKVGAEQSLPWETDETWCCCACRRLLCVPLGMQFTALPTHSATSTLAMALLDMLRKTLDRCRLRLQVLPRFVSVPLCSGGGLFYLVPCSDLPHGLNSSAGCLPTVQVSRQWEWFIYRLCRPERGRSKTWETDWRTPRSMFHKRRGKWCKTKMFTRVPPFFWHSSWDLGFFKKGYFTQSAEKKKTVKYSWNVKNDV